MSTQVEKREKYSEFQLQFKFSFFSLQKIEQIEPEKESTEFNQTKFWVSFVFPSLCPRILIFPPFFSYFLIKYIPQKTHKKLPFAIRWRLLERLLLDLI